jgi:hypothetical protein
VNELRNPTRLAIPLGDKNCPALRQERWEKQCMRELAWQTLATFTCDAQVNCCAIAN